MQSSMSDQKSSARTRTVRVRQTIQPSSAVKTSLSVLCAETKTSLKLDDCFRCAEFGWLEVDPSNDRFVLTCGQVLARKGMLVDGGRNAPKRGAFDELLGESLSTVMTSKVYCIAKETPIEVLAMLFLEREVSAAPVVDGDGRPLGLVSKTDLVRALFGDSARSGAAWLEHESDSTAERLLRFAAAGGVAEGTAENLMTPVPFTIAESATLIEAIGMMSEQRLHHAVVLSSEGYVVGILSALDIVDLVAKHSARLGNTK
jgi:CBS domain-containing protein